MICRICCINKDFDLFPKGRNTCKVCRSLYNLKWRKLNPEKVKANKIKWRKLNPEKVKAYNIKWRKLNPEKDKANKIKWRKLNHEKTIEYVKKYYKLNAYKIGERKKRYVKLNFKKCKELHYIFLNKAKIRLTNTYVKDLMRRNYSIKNNYINEDFINSYREIVKIKRLIKLTKQQNGKSKENFKTSKSKVSVS